MRATLCLVKEHEAILKALALLERTAGGLGEGRAGAEEDLDRLLDFLRDYADALHHGKEEAILFPKMGRGPSAGVVRLTEDEHPAGRALVARLRRGLEVHRGGGKDAAGELSRVARDLRHHLCAHINREDHVVFPMAERHLTASEKADLVAQMEALEARLFPGAALEARLSELAGLELRWAERPIPF